MDQPQQPRWKTIGRWVLWAVLWTGGIALALAFVYILYGGYRYGWKWAGMVKDPDFRERTLWDWLQLLIIPAVIAGGGIWFNQQQRGRELEIEAQRAQDDTLQSYLDQMSHLMLLDEADGAKPKPLRKSGRKDEV